jgi:hypothetical protein
MPLNEAILSGVFGISDFAGLPNVRELDVSSTEIVAVDAKSRAATQVLVEGFSSAGKTNFAARLAQRLGWRHIECDGLALEGVDSPRYADHIDRQRLTSLLSQANAGSVIDGVCLRDFLNSATALPVPISVYIARVSRSTGGHLLWHDMLDLTDEDGKEPWLFADIRRYHKDWAPHGIADWMFLRVEP